MLRIIRSPQALQKLCLQLRLKKKTIALVPTMGYLHEGHVSLLRLARTKADIVILSIFVNPTQFGPTEDLSRYPRDTQGDLAKARQAKVDYVFFPEPKTMYPEGFQTYVEVTEATKELCGASRPTHFKGVTTVVLKLFNIIQPHLAIFGRKDFQQLAVIQRMVKDLNVPIKIIGAPLVREKDGLAMSSRNVYLSPEERQQALALSRGLFKIKKMSKKHGDDTSRFLQIIRDEITAQPLARIDYIDAMDAETIQPLKVYRKNRTLLALAVFVGKTRLIDNVVV